MVGVKSSRKSAKKTAAKKSSKKGLASGGRATTTLIKTPSGHAIGILSVTPPAPGDAEFNSVADYAGALGWLLACRTYDENRIDVERYNARFLDRAATSKERLLVLLDALESLQAFTMNVPSDSDWARLELVARLLRGETTTGYGQILHALDIVATGIRFREKLEYPERVVRSDLAYHDPLFEKMPLAELRALMMGAVDNEGAGGRGNRGPKFVLATIIARTGALGGGSLGTARSRITSAESASKK